MDYVVQINQAREYWRVPYELEPCVTVMKEKRFYARSSWRASAGVAATQVRPEAITAMREIGIDNLHHRSKADQWFGCARNTTNLEKKWFNERVGPHALEAPDFSATTDLYSIVAYSEGMRLLPFDLRTVVYLVIVSLLPIVPVVFMTIPLSVIIDEAAKLLL